MRQFNLDTPRTRRASVPAAAAVEEPTPVAIGGRIE
jgi:hypothetical protein